MSIKLPSSFAFLTLMVLGVTLPTHAFEATTVRSLPVASAQSSRDSLKISQSFKPPRRGAAPPTAGGATRGDSCLKGTKQLTSLIPQNRLGLTYSSNPTFYWYIPQSPAKTAKFLLLGNDDADLIYETTLSLPKEPGIVNFTLPATAPKLEIGKQYHWYLVVGCSVTDQSANPSVEGWVERVAPETVSVSQVEKLDPKERATIYAENGIWFEAVSTLAKLRQSNPKDGVAIAGWNELLKSVGLDAIAAEPLLNAPLSKN